jgi:hypothetical protein
MGASNSRLYKFNSAAEYTQPVDVMFVSDASVQATGFQIEYYYGKLANNMFIVKTIIWNK